MTQALYAHMNKRKKKMIGVELEKTKKAGLIEIQCHLNLPLVSGIV
jgi:hypothetical protein